MKDVNFAVEKQKEKSIGISVISEDKKGEEVKS